MRVKDGESTALSSQEETEFSYFFSKHGFLAIKHSVIVMSFIFLKMFLLLSERRGGDRKINERESSIGCLLHPSPPGGPSPQPGHVP